MNEEYVFVNFIRFYNYIGFSNKGGSMLKWNKPGCVYLKDPVCLYVWNMPINHSCIRLHPQEATVWCGFWAVVVIGPYFFENNVGEAITVNGEPYRSMITNFFWPELNDMDVNDMLFQQHGATCHKPQWTFCVNDLRVG